MLMWYCRLSTLDAHVYASIAPVLHLDLPSAFLREILSGYPTLIKHAIRVGDKLFSNFTPTQVEAPQFSFRTLLPSFDWSGLGSKTGSRIRTEKEKDLAVKRAWYILGVVSQRLCKKVNFWDAYANLTGLLFDCLCTAARHYPVAGGRGLERRRHQVRGGRRRTRILNGAVRQAQTYSLPRRQVASQARSKMKTSAVFDLLCTANNSYSL